MMPRLADHDAGTAIRAPISSDEANAEHQTVADATMAEDSDDPSQRH